MSCTGKTRMAISISITKVVTVLAAMTGGSCWMHVERSRDQPLDMGEQPKIPTNTAVAINPPHHDEQSDEVHTDSSVCTT